MPIRQVTFFLAALLGASTSALGAQALPYQFSKGRLTSAMQPEIQLKVDTSLSYIGSQRWILYNVAQAEQQLFVQRSATGVSRFLWVQFEEYIPAANGRYDYSSDTPINAFGREWRVSPEMWNIPTTESRPASDGAYARKMLREHGIILPPQMVYERFIYLPDATHRRELMVIYAEDAASRGVSTMTPAQREAMFAEHQRNALRAFEMISR
ncbi:MAG: hypothetical protein ABIZ70_09995 [Gemmatimonadales bacterium]